MTWYYFCEALTFTYVISVSSCWWCPCFVLKSWSGSGYFSADGQSARSSWYRAPHLGPMTRFVLVSDICGLHVVCRLPWREDGSVIYFYNLFTLRSKSRRTHDRILLSHLRLPQPGGPGPVFISPRNRVAQLYSRELGSRFLASWNSQVRLSALHAGRALLL
jgi:hypothetical protein